MRQDIISRKTEIEQWVSEHQSLTTIAAWLNCKIDTLKKYLKLMDIDYNGNKGSKGFRLGKQHPKYKSAELALIKTADRPSMKAGRLKEKLFLEGIKQKVCECCGLSTWLGEEIPLELHHIDGNKNNNTIENLQILCPNCHAKTDTYRGKNIKSARTKRIENAGLVKQENTTLLNSVASAYGFDSRAPHHKEMKSIAEHDKLASIGKIDSLYRTNERYLSDNEWEMRKQLILNSGVDLTKLGWKTEVEKVTGLTRRQICLTVEHFNEFFNKIVYKRKSPTK